MKDLNNNIIDLEALRILKNKFVNLELLSDANVTVLGKGWKNSRGCRIEHECAVQYGISVIYIENL